MPQNKSTKPTSTPKSLDNHPISSRTRSKTNTLKGNEIESSKTESQIVKNDKEDGISPNKQETKCEEEKGMQTEKPQRISKRLMLKELKKTNPNQLKTIFGKTDISWSDFVNGLHSCIIESEPEKLNMILNLEIFDFECEATDIINPVLWDKETSYIRPVSLAVDEANVDCLNVLIRSKAFRELRAKMIPVLGISLLSTIFAMNDCDSSEFKKIFKCFKFLLLIGAPLGKKTWPLDYFDQHIHERTEHIQILHAAGADFEFDEEDNYDDPSGFLSYLDKKYNPRPDSRGFYQPRTLQYISRDAIRNYLMDQFVHSVNVFMFTTCLVRQGHLTVTAADYLVYNYLSSDERDDEEASSD